MVTGLCSQGHSGPQEYQEASHMVPDGLFSSVKEEARGPAPVCDSMASCGEDVQVCQPVHPFISFHREPLSSKVLSTVVGHVWKEISQDVSTILCLGGRIMSEINVQIPLCFLNFLPCLKQTTKPY